MTLDHWLAAQERVSAASLRAAVSATHLTHTRPAFGLTVGPAPGSVLASLVRALWDPEPDYFYHWLRDAAVVMLAAGPIAATDSDWQAEFAHHVAFSLRIATRPGPATNPLRPATAPTHAQYLRPDAELAALAGDALLGEPRVGADGSADAEQWGRPQFDGPALRALSCLRWPGPPPDGLDRLLALDLAFTLRHAAAPTIGPWEEEPPALHAFTLLAQRSALRAGRDRLDPAALEAALDRIEAALDALWDAEAGHLRASSLATASDANILLGALLEPTADTFGVLDQRMAATAAHIERWSVALYPLATVAAPLVGRWPDDVYFGGNPWLPTSLGLAEFRFRRAALGQSEDFARGDATLAAVQALFPTPGPLPEQVHRTTGAPASCRDLTWSHAALLAAAEARRAALSSSERPAADP